MESKDVVASDGQKLGTIVDERDDCLIIETGHVFRTKHAIPRDFVHEHEGQLVATVTKELVGPAARELGSERLLDRIDPGACEADLQLESATPQEATADVAARSVG